MKVKIVDFSLFKESNGYEFARELEMEYISEVYAIVKTQKYSLVLLYFSALQALHLFTLNDSLQIIDNSENGNWLKVRNFDGGDYIFSNGGAYYQHYRYKEVYSPEWMILDKSFFMELYEKPDIAKEKFFHHEGTSMIK